MGNVQKQVIDGKEYTVVQLTNQPKKNRYAEEDQFLQDVATVAYLFPQYTLKDIYEELPAYQVRALIRAARREQATQLLLLNGIIHGPNAKRKDDYKKLLRNLQKQAKQDNS